MITPQLPRDQAGASGQWLRHYRSMLVRGGKVAGVFETIRVPEAEIKTSSCLKKDLGGAVVLPGLIDSHGHLFMTGFTKTSLDLSVCKSEGEMVAAVEKAALSTTGWIVGFGWDQTQWGESALPTNKLLSAAVPSRPVSLTRIDGHALLANDYALKLAFAGLDKADLNEGIGSDGGEIVRTADGRASGVLLENAMKLIQQKIPQPSVDEQRAALKNGMDSLAMAGVTMFHECGANGVELQVLQEFARSSALTVRMHVFLDGQKSELLRSWFSHGPWRSEDGMLGIAGVKLFADGALGSRGALLKEDYTDECGNRGIALLDAEKIADQTRAACEAGFQVATHAIGDLANHNVIAAYQQMGRNGFKDVKALRLRIEHAQIVGEADLKLMAEIGAVASVQACHCTSDGLWALARLGLRRVQSDAYRWKSFLAAGIPLCNGTDTPIEPAKPFWTMHAAVTRRRRDDRAFETNFDECLSAEEALYAMTLGGAFAAFCEREVGALLPGYFADFVVVDRDPLSCPSAEIHEVEVLQTWVGGKKIFDAAKQNAVKGGV